MVHKLLSIVYSGGGYMKDENDDELLAAMPVRKAFLDLHFQR